MNLVESHVHIWTVRDPRFGKHPDSDFTPDREAAPADLFAAQDEVGGVAWTVLIQPRYYLWDNAYLAQAAEAHPDRFVVAGRVNPMEREAPRQLRELMQWPGYRGIRLAATEDPATRWLDDSSQDPLWEVAAETRATIGLLIQWRQLPQAAAMATRHPDVTVVIDHLGFPDYDDPGFAGEPAGPCPPAERLRQALGLSPQHRRRLSLPARPTLHPAHARRLRRLARHVGQRLAGLSRPRDLRPGLHVRLGAALADRRRPRLDLQSHRPRRVAHPGRPILS